MRTKAKDTGEQVELAVTLDDADGWGAASMTLQLEPNEAVQLARELRTAAERALAVHHERHGRGRSGLECSRCQTLAELLREKP